jgi:phosphate transport system substrate-binding protein
MNRRCFVAIWVISAAVGCTSGGAGSAGDTIRIDGSSTVYPLTTAVVEEFAKAQPAARIEVRFSGTSAGFERFCNGEIDIQDASRPIEPEELDTCRASSIDFVELPVAHDGLTIILHPSNDWAESLSVRELKTLWEPAADGKVTRWSHIRKEWPDRPIVLVGPGPRSGTFDFFTLVVVGRERASRADYTQSEDDELIVRGVASNPDALGYVGYTYFEQHRANVKAARVDDLDDSIGQGAIEPSVDTVRRGLYRPLSRPLFIYVNRQRLERPEVKTFVDFFIRHIGTLAPQIGGIPLNPRLYELVQQRASNRVQGSLFSGPESNGRTLDELLIP